MGLVDLGWEGEEDWVEEGREEEEGLEEGVRVEAAVEVGLVEAEEGQEMVGAVAWVVWEEMGV